MKTKKKLNKVTSIVNKVHKRIKLGLFKTYSKLHAPRSKDHGKTCGHWIAFDARGYHLSQGKSALEAIAMLFEVLEIKETWAAEFKAQGHKVIVQNAGKKWRKEVQEELTRRSKIGLIEIDWRDWSRVLPRFGR